MAARRRSLLAALLTSVLITALFSAPGTVALAQSDPGGFPEITLPEGQCAVRTGNDLITFTGSLEPGTTLQQVALRDFDANDVQIGLDRDITARNAVSISPEGVLSGTTQAGGKDFPSDSSFIRAALTVVNGETITEYVTDPLRVDRVRPTFEGARTTGAKTVVVQFSESVSSADGDFAQDWIVADEPASKISGSGATRTLEVSVKNIGEDELVDVEYSPLPSHGGYKDCAGNSLSFAAGLSRRSSDGIAPRIPRITQLASESAASQVSSRDDTPSAVVDTATNGHRIVLYRESSDTQSFDPDEDIQLAEATVSGGSAIFNELPSFGSDGTYTLYALALDVNGNPSVDAGGNVAGDAASYRLDREAPHVLDARTTGSRVAVTFTEALVGGNNASDWAITGCTVACTIDGVSGSGDTRVLSIATGGFVPNAAQISYTRPATNGYDDEAGNPLESFGSVTTEGLAPKTVDLEPEEGTNTVGDDYALTATVEDDFGVGVPGSIVGLRATSGPSSRKDFDGTGPNPIGVIGSCFTQADGECELTYSSNAAELDELQAWIDSDGNVATFEALQPEPRDESTGNLPNQDVVDVAWNAIDAALQVDATPEEAEVLVGEPHVVTVQVESRDKITDLNAGTQTAIEDIVVGLRAVDGPNEGNILDTCKTDSEGTCKVTYGSTLRGTDVLQAWIDKDRDGTVAGDDLAPTGSEPDDADGSLALNDPLQDVISATWSGAAVLRLNLEPEHSTRKPGSSAPLDFSVFDGDSQPVEGLNVDARVVSGPNAGKHYQCITDEAGVCSTEFPSTKVGEDVVQGWIDLNGNDLADEPTRFEAVDEEADGGDLVQDSIAIDWVIEGLRIDADPETTTVPVDRSVPMDVSALDADGSTVQGVPIAARIVGAELLGTCLTGPDGVCGFDLAPHRVVDAQVQVWIDLNRDLKNDEASTPESAGEVGEDAPNQDVLDIHWVLQGADLFADAGPETSIAKIGTEKTITLAAADAATNPIAGVPMQARVISGPNDSRDLGSCVSSSVGSCTVSYSSESAGTDLVVAWVDADRDRSPNEISGQPEERGATGAADVHNHDVVEVTWGTRSERLISLTSPPAETVRFRAPVRFQGSIDSDAACRDGAEVELQQRSVGADRFETIARLTAASSGDWSATIRPRSTATYRAIVGEDEACIGAHSDPVAIAVKAKVRATAVDETIGSSSCTAVVARVLPRRAGAQIVLQRRSSTGWKNIGLGKLSKRSRARFRVCPNATSTYRVLWPGDERNERSVSRSFRIRVS